MSGRNDDGGWVGFGAEFGFGVVIGMVGWARRGEFGVEVEVAFHCIFI